MTNPGPPGGDERPLAGPETGMGLPESGTQHATSTDFALPVDRFAESGGDPLGGAGTAGAASTPPPAQPASPLYDELMAPLEAQVDAPGSDGPVATGGALDKVKAFAARRPEAFLGATLVAGLLVGRLLSSSDDEES